ncbi:NAD(P)-binding protein [Candidatus Nitrospira allomarina]|uniref:NAD(P)-binding protein n=1 Tax=Candidatus Nitrospira allomarina TaxID=3020900 RepID=A0AA96GJ91_9BACT|nr:NAD(P)-binding protein [Candidatus Nitrospira allomarina]WNM59958.1 NAD(P)-binding protein [Candidatus Nitrospira allomarina]
MMEQKPFAITLNPASSLANHTGTWRTMRPIYVDHLPPCNQGCPAGENIQGWLYEAEEGKYEQAWRKIMEDNPFPAIHGRVCYHPCETACNRGQLDEPVSIHAVERFLGDYAIEQGWQVEAGVATGRRVLVVGAGPSGLSAAYHLARLGHAVTIIEAGPKPGGMMRFGIPQYRLPRNVLDAEIARIVAMGVSIHLNQKVDNLETIIKEGGFDAVFLAIGAHLSKRVDIPGRDAGRMIDALGFLKGMDGQTVPKIGRRVVVYGGGDTAIDAARTAKRLGAEETILIYRRDRGHMPAHDFEVEEALEEGVLTRWLHTIRQVNNTTLTVEEMTLDEQGRPQPTGRMETLEADTVILAVGQEVDTGFLENVPGLDISSDGVIQVDASMMTGRAGVFAGGDMVPAERTVTVASGHGKKAARHIDAYLRGSEYRKPLPNTVATYDRLNTWYYTDADKSRQPYLDLARRRASFEEVVGGLDKDTALLEARRCLSCGNCFECDTCYGVCPDNAIIKLGPGQRYEVNYDYCKGCGVCAEECPCGAIDMVKEVR